MMVFGGSSFGFLLATGMGFHVVPLVVFAAATGGAFFIGMY